MARIYICDAFESNRGNRNYQRLSGRRYCEELEDGAESILSSARRRIDRIREPEYHGAGNGSSQTMVIFTTKWDVRKSIIKFYSCAPSNFINAAFERKKHVEYGLGVLQWPGGNAN
jgi:hypothetical protein